MTKSHRQECKNNPACHNYSVDIGHCNKLKNMIYDAYEQTEWYLEHNNPFDLSKELKLKVMSHLFFNFTFEDFGRSEIAKSMIQIFNYNGHKIQI